jgi:hypothetical protein
MTPAGLEPATYCLGGSRSIHLSYEVDFPIDIIYQVRSRFSSHAWHPAEPLPCGGGAATRSIPGFSERLSATPGARSFRCYLAIGLELRIID